MAEPHPQTPSAKPSGRRSPWRRRLQIAGAVYLVVVGYLIYNVTLGGNFHTVTSGVVYRSAQPTERLLRSWVADHQIKTVVNLRGRWHQSGWHIKEKQTTEGLGVGMVDIDLCSYKLAPISELRKLIRVLDESPRPLLLHCRRGADRTSLACAIWRVIQEDRTPAEALAEYRLMYGHVGYARGNHLPHLFDCYEQWLKSTGQTHTGSQFRHWINTMTTLAYFGAKLTVGSPPTVVATGQPWTFVVRIENISAMPWELRRPFSTGIHLKVWPQRLTEHDDTGVEIPLGELPPRDDGLPFALGTPGVIAPGAAVETTITMPAVNEPGEFAIRFDCVDEGDFAFHRIGYGGAEFRVQFVDNNPATAQRTEGTRR